MRRRIKCNIWGTPIFTDEERVVLRRILISRRCKVCKAKAGYACVIGRWKDGETSFKDRSRRMEAGKVHMGRLPAGFDSLKAVEEAMNNLQASG